ncbi:MAG TPA: hypothetical protein VIJ63_00840 [Roseiarcus sp.]
MVENLGLVGEESFATIGANWKWQRVFGFLRRPLRHGLSARSAQRTCTKGALVHVSHFLGF